MQNSASNIDTNHAAFVAALRRSESIDIFSAVTILPKSNGSMQDGEETFDRFVEVGFCVTIGPK